jgi:bifunctional UDP-N-acetylglucosamine pyrophosphorylase/glucosamine-1-phosphate N-acetyltransferase
VPLSVVILAAGQGKRMNSDLPKVLQPLAGEPLLRHVLRTARALAPACIHVVYGHGGDAVPKAFAQDADLSWVLQAEQQGTGHAVLKAMPAVPDDHTVLVLYGDVPLVRAPSLQPLIAAAAAGGLAVLTVHLNDPQGYGRVLREAGGRVTGIIEERDASPDERRIDEVNTGLMAAPARRLRDWLQALKADNAQREYYLTDVVASAVAADAAVTAFPVAEAAEVLGVNDRIQLAEAEAGLRRMRTRELLLAGATLADPARVDVRGTVTVERDVYIDVGAVLLGRVHLGARVKVGPNCLIRDAYIGADTEINANSVIEEARTAENCRIGPFARLRPGTVLARDAHVGNFVEVKNATIGEGSKANHLTYLGDATVGAGVNVGAGTITCNYDGVNKWPTEIGDGAFIGSGSMLVAPVRVGAGATIGAGSTITESTDDDKLTLTRARQTTIENWSRPGKLPDEEKAAAISKALKKPGTP